MLTSLREGNTVYGFCVAKAHHSIIDSQLLLEIAQWQQQEGEGQKCETYHWHSQPRNQ